MCTLLNQELCMDVEHIIGPSVPIEAPFKALVHKNPRSATVLYEFQWI